MNKTITINIGGAVFNIEEDAYELLKNYLDSIKANFNSDASADEIMADIEGRIAELFSQYLNDKKNVIVISDVESVIEVMGQPEDYGTGEPMGNTQNGPQAAAGSERLKHDTRRIYRDKDDAYIGGVCSGLSYYLGWDPMVLRILFIILVFAGGSGIPAYIILWAVIPPAYTTAEKLRMRGEPVNIDNISKFVNQEAKNAKENIQRFGNKSREKAEQFRGAGTDFGRFLRKALGLAFILFSIGMLIAVVTGSFFANYEIFGNTTNWEIVKQLIFKNDGTLWMIVIGLLLVVLSPILAILYAGVRLIVDKGRTVRGIGWSLLALFFIGGIMTALGGGKMITEFRKDGEVVTTNAVELNATDTLYIDVMPDTVFTGREINGHDDFFDMIKIENDRVVYGEPISFYIETSRSSETPKLVVTKSSQGQNLIEAGERASRIEYNYTIEGNRIQLAPLFQTLKDEPFRGQHVDIELELPEGTMVKFNENIGFISWYNEYISAVARVGEEGLD